MRYITRAFVVGVLALFAVGVLDQSRAAATPLVVVVSASGAELDGPAALGSYDLTFLFDAGLIVQSVTFGTELGGPAQSIQSNDSSLPGSLLLSELSLLFDLSAQPDAFVLATVLLDVSSGTLADAFASFHLDPASPGLGDDLGNVLPLRLVQLSSPSVTSTPTADPVPEPATLTLLGAGLAAAAARRYLSR